MSRPNKKIAARPEGHAAFPEESEQVRAFPNTGTLADALGSIPSGLRFPALRLVGERQSRRAAAQIWYQSRERNR